MNALLLIVIVAAGLLQSVAKKQYIKKSGKYGSYIFNSVATLCACGFFLCTDTDGFQFDPAVIPYVLGFAVSYGMAVLFNLLAIREGPLSMTALVTNYSLIIPTFYGLLFLKESASIFFYLGFGFLLCSLFLLGGKKSDTAIRLKWVIYAVLLFLGNGFCSVVQTAQQGRFAGAYKNEFMILALLLVSVFFFVMAIVKERERLLPCVKNGAHYMLLKGIGNGCVNLLVMVLLSRGLPASIAFPVISGGGIVLSSLLSIFVYKEKLSWRQYIGLILGAAAVVFMNI